MFVQTTFAEVDALTSTATAHQPAFRIYSRLVGFTEAPLDPVSGRLCRLNAYMTALEAQKVCLGAPFSELFQQFLILCLCFLLKMS